MLPVQIGAHAADELCALRLVTVGGISPQSGEDHVVVRQQGGSSRNQTLSQRSAVNVYWVLEAKKKLNWGRQFHSKVCEENQNWN